VKLRWSLVTTALTLATLCPQSPEPEPEDEPEPPSPPPRYKSNPVYGCPHCSRNDGSHNSRCPEKKT
jgi:hypothetical protein